MESVEANSLWKKISFIGLIVVCLLPIVSTVDALIDGILFSLILGDPLPQQSSHWSKVLLQVSVVGLGFGQSLWSVCKIRKI